jgi:hypothetical protein
MSYVESKKKIDAIRQEYGCKGEVLFRTAIQYVVEYGKDLLNDDGWFKGEIHSIDAYHDKAEMEGKTLWVTRGFEKAILECAKKLAGFDAYDFLTYIQKEVWLDGGKVGEPDYQRAMEIIRNCLSYMAGCYGAYTYDNEEILEKFRCVMEDHEIEFFGWEELFEDEDLEE